MGDRDGRQTAVQTAEDVASRDFDALIDGGVGRRAMGPSPWDGVIVGTLVGFADNGATPLVAYPGQPGVAALPARSTVDLHGAHVGRDAVLTFEAGDPLRPIVVGCIRPAVSAAVPPSVGRVEVDADGERLVVTAERGLVLRCGKASITLSQDGRVTIRGTQVVSHASGLNRVKGGAVQIN